MLLYGLGHGGGGGGHHGGGGGHHDHSGIQHGVNWGPSWHNYAPEVYVVQPSCSDIYDPVMGTDGITYPNACKAAEAGAGVAKYLRPGLHGISDMGPTARVLTFGALSLALVAGALVGYRKYAR